MDHAVSNASESGFSHMMRLPAPSGFPAYGANMLSESVLDLNDLTKTNGNPAAVMKKRSLYDNPEVKIPGSSCSGEMRNVITNSAGRDGRVLFRYYSAL